MSVNTVFPKVRLVDSGATQVGPTFDHVVAGSAVRLVSVSTIFASSAVAGNRQPALVILDASSNVRYQSNAATPHAASLTRRYSWSSSADGTTSTPNSPLAQMVVPVGFTIRVHDEAGIDAGDLQRVLLSLDLVELN